MSVKNNIIVGEVDMSYFYIDVPAVGDGHNFRFGGKIIGRVGTKTIAGNIVDIVVRVEKDSQEI